MKIESTNIPDKVNSHNTNKTKKTNVFDDVFEKMFKTQEDTKKTAEKTNKKKTSVSAKDFLELESKITDPNSKKLFDKFFTELVNKSNDISKKISLTNEAELSKLKTQIKNGEIDFKLDIPVKSLESLEKKFDIKKTDIEILINNTNSSSTVTDNKANPFDKNLSVPNTTDTNIEKENTLNRLSNKKENIELPNTNLFDELKKQRIENNQIGLNINSNQTSDTNFQTFNVKNDHLKLGDWIESFKTEISKLTEFKIENTQKVSMMLKEQGDELRIIVEKRDSYILVKAQATENMKDRLDSILYEVQAEMKERGIELKVEVKQEEEDKREEEEDNSDENYKNEKHHSGGKDDDNDNNESSK